MSDIPPVLIFGSLSVVAAITLVVQIVWLRRDMRRLRNKRK